MSLIKKYIKHRLSKTKFSEFSTSWNVAHGQGDYVNIYGEFSASEGLEHILKEVTNPIIQFYLKKYLEDCMTDNCFTSGRELRGGNNESMTFYHCVDWDIIDTWQCYANDIACKNGVKPDAEPNFMMPQVMLSEISRIIHGYMAGLEEEVRLLCDSLLSDSHTISMATYHDHEIVIDKNIGNVEVRVDVMSASDADTSILIEDDTEFVESVFSSLINDGSKIVDLRAQISYQGFSSSYYLSNNFVKETDINKLAIMHGKESISEFRHEYEQQLLGAA